MNLQTLEASHTVVRPAVLDGSTIGCVYPTSAISLSATGAVARALAQVLDWIASESPGSRVLAACPGGGDVNGIDFLDTRFTAGEMLLYRATNHHLLRRVVPSEFRATREHLGIRKGAGAIARRVGTVDYFLCATSSGPRAARRVFPQASVIYWIHSLPCMGNEAEGWKAIQCSDMVVVPSRAIYESLFQMYCRNQFRPPVWVVPPLVDFQPSPPTPDQRAESRAAFGLRKDDFAVAHVGRASMKGLQVVERALASCDAGGRRLALLSGGGRQRRQRRVAAHAEVFELGYLTQKQLTQLYWACDVGVVPSVWFESFGLVVAEMMSSGLCVIASRVGGIPEIIEHDATGLLVDLPNEVTSWTANLQRAIDDDLLRRRLAAAAPGTVASRFGREPFLHEWRRVFDNLTA